MLETKQCARGPPTMVHCLGKNAVGNQMNFESFLTVSISTVSLMNIRYYWYHLSVSKLLRMTNQSLFDGLVSCQNHHLLGSKVDCEHRSIRLGKLGPGMHSYDVIMVTTGSYQTGYYQVKLCVSVQDNYCNCNCTP